MSVDTAMAVLSALVLEGGHRWGDIATPWQWADARAVLSGLVSKALLTRPRGGSKTTDVAGVAIAVLLAQAPRGARSYAFAVDQDQAGLLVDSVAGFVERTPGLGGMRVDRWRVTAPNGATLDVMAADAASAFGLIPYLVIVDELAQWATTYGPRRLWSAIVSGLPKRVDSRLVAITTAGDPSHWSAKVLAHARASAEWHVNEVPGPVPWISPTELAEQRALLLPSTFAQLHLNQWAAAEDRLTSPDDLRHCVTHSGPLSPSRDVDRYVVGLDVGTVKDRTVAAVCHADGPPGQPRVVVDRVQVWSGSKSAPVSLLEVEEWVATAALEYKGAEVAYDPFQALHLAEGLRRRGLRTHQHTFSQQSNGRLALLLFQLLRARRLALPDDEGLLDELATVQLREKSPGVYRIDHSASGHDDQVVAIGVAVSRLVEHHGAVRSVDPASHRPLPGDEVPEWQWFAEKAFTHRLPVSGPRDRRPPTIDEFQW